MYYAYALPWGYSLSYHVSSKYVQHSGVVRCVHGTKCLPVSVSSVLQRSCYCFNCLLNQGEISVARLFLESGIWDILWHRLAQMLQVQSAHSDMPLFNLEPDVDSTDGVTFTSPDWGLLSMQGLLGALQLAVSVFTKVSLLLTFTCSLIPIHTHVHVV